MSHDGFARIDYRKRRGGRLDRRVQPVIAVEHRPIGELFPNFAVELVGFECINAPQALCIIIDTNVEELERRRLAKRTEDLSNGVLVDQNKLSSSRAGHADSRGAHAYDTRTADEVNAANLFEGIGK
jgi:hypothetical protein